MPLKCLVNRIIENLNRIRTAHAQAHRDSRPTGVPPDEFVLWNAFPWHSFNPRCGVLSNRMPNKFEQLSGRAVLKAFLKLFPCKRIIALGKIAAAQLAPLDVNAYCVRHPASGGAKLFREQIARIVP